jgi:hypothetical protein
VVFLQEGASRRGIEGIQNRLHRIEELRGDENHLFLSLVDGKIFQVAQNLSMKRSIL